MIFLMENIERKMENKISVFPHIRMGCLFIAQDGTGDNVISCMGRCISFILMINI